MINDFIGSWNINVASPLGTDAYTLFISETASAQISEMRGKMNFDDVRFESNNFYMSGTTLTPTKAQVIMEGFIVGNDMKGKVRINEYCTVDFSGAKNG
jgi:hypothetical protein